MYKNTAKLIRIFVLWEYKLDYLEKIEYYKEMKSSGKKPRNVKNIDI